MTLRLDRASRRLLAASIACAVAAAAAAVLLLSLSGWFLTGAALAGAAGPIAAQAFNYLIPSAAIRLFAIVRTLGRYGERLFSHRAALGAMASLRADLFAALAAQDSRTAPDLAAGDATARLTGDVAALEDLVIRRPSPWGCGTAALIGVALVIPAGWAPALLLAALLAVLPALLAGTAARLTRTPAAALAAAAGDLHTRYVACAESRAEIAAWGLATHVTADLAAIAARRDAAAAALHRGEGAIAALLAAVTGLGVAGVVALARAPAPLVALAALAAAAAIEATGGLARDSARRARTTAAIARLNILTDLPAAAPAAAQPGPLRLGPLALAPGARIAITGRSGTGKTLALEALAGWRAIAMDAAIGATPLAACAPATLAQMFALSPQSAATIAGTVADNLRLARPGLDDAAMWAALTTAGLADRVRALPDGLATWLGDGGAPLSGGERKRLSLARALLAKRAWLLLDEPTEGLDAATEARVVADLDAWLAGTGTGLILVSHRPAPLAIARQSLPVATLAPRIPG